MKTIKIVLLLLAFSAVTFYSCSDSDPIQKQTVATRSSVALRTMLNEMKSSNAVMGGKPAKTEGKTAITNPFCFEFVYPITLSFNNQVTVSVANLQGLIDILSSETPNLYIDGIAFPFQVTYGGAVHTIATEANFTSLIQTCGFNTINQDLLNTTCFDIVYPIEVIAGDDFSEVIGSDEDLLAYVSEHANVGVAILYPISVNQAGQIIVVHNLYELYDVINSCDTCVCQMYYDPVCVMTTNGVVEYSNICFAECAGFTENDLVPCNSQGCDISGETVTIGACNNDGTFALTLNFNYVNPLGNTFTVRNGNYTLVGTYNLSDLPITIPNYPLAVSTVDNLHIDIGVNCAGSAIFMPPACPCVCTTQYDPVCVQGPNGTPISFTNPSCAACAGYGPEDFITCGVAPSNFGTQLGSCFSIQYPVNVMAQGQIIQVTNNGQLLQYWNAATTMPSMVYPITVIFNGNSLYTLTNQAAFEAAIQANCN